MPHCVSMLSSTPSPLLALVGATAEWHVGTPPSCSAHVRVLDRVHFTVHRGDCVVVHHDDPASARVLLAALAGSPALLGGRRLTGARLAAPAVRIRRCSVTADALDAVLEGWRDLRPDAAAMPSTSIGTSGAAVHLLRASRRAPLSTREFDQWRAWARRIRLEGGAVVAVATPQPVGAMETAMAPASSPSRAPWTWPPRAGHHGAPHRQGRVHEHPNHEAPPPEQMLPAAAPRGVWLRHGQLFNLRAWE